MSAQKEFRTAARRTREAQRRLASGYEQALLDHCGGECPHCETGPTCERGRALARAWWRAALKEAGK